MLKRFSLALLNVCLITAFSKAQNPNDFIALKSITPPSPEAAAITRYGEIPTDMSTGVPQISIPLYEIKSSKLSLPISLSYHASGIKLQDIATPVGLGWVLNAGGEISRTVIGKPDEGTAGLLNMSTNAYNTFKNRDALINVRYNADDFTYLDDMAQGHQDCQSDIYSYNTGDISGRFVYDVDKVLHFTPVDRQPKITWQPDSSFIVIDDAGNIYLYGDKEYSDNLIGLGHYITSWHLSKITSADQTDSIELHYLNATVAVDSVQSFGLSVIVPIFYGTDGCNHDAPDISYYTGDNVYSHQRKLIDSIKFSNGYVKFDYVNDRKDILPERLSKIKISNTSNIIKEIQFSQSYFESPYIPTGVDSSYGKRLRLDTVYFNDKNSAHINNYSLIYDTTNKLPAYRVLKSSNSIPNPEMDFYGYYNANNATTLLPKGFYNQLYSFLHDNYYAVSNTIMSEYTSKSANRFTNPEVMQADILKKINFPTGGYTMFEYETNSINDSEDSASYRGGLRVSKVVSFDTINRRPVVKSYSYDSAFSISGNIPRDLYYQQRNIQHSIAPGGGSVSAGWCNTFNFNIVSSPFTALNYYNGSPVIYSKVTEYNGFPGLNNGKTIYVYDAEGDSSYSPDYTDKYWNFSTDKSWARGQLLNKKVYKLESDSNILIQETKNYYSSLGLTNVKVGQICERYTLMFGSLTGDLSGYMVDTLTSQPYGDRFLLNYYEYLDVVLPFGIKKLIKSEDIDYLNNQITQTKEFFYEGTDHLYPTRTLTFTSKGNDTLAEIVRYPQDKLQITGLTTPASDAIDGMVSHNILTSPVQTETYRNSQLLTRNRIDFKEWSTGKFYEEYRYTKKGDGPLEPRVQYKHYDVAGNLVTMGQYSGTDISYVWDYNNAYPTAQVTNAGDSTIAYTSFETADGGGWAVPGLGTITQCITGKRAANISGGVTKYNLSLGKEYIVSYWSQGGAATVSWHNGLLSSGTVTGVSKQTKNGWTLYEHILPVTASNVTVQGNILVDELRLYPKNAQMVTYTYEPLLGVSSSCSANDLVTKYEYDDFGRLRTIRDADSNILKIIDYKYNIPQGQGISGWAITGNITGGADTGYSNFLLERQEKDYNSSSPTYNQKRWVAFSLGNNTPNWVATGQTYCIKNGNNENIGEMGEYIDTNPYSSKYGKTKWSPVNTGNCPPPEDPCTDEGKKVVNGICEMGVKVYTGSYYDIDHWVCIYHYEWSDSSTSDDYEEYRNDGCPEDE